MIKFIKLHKIINIIFCLIAFSFLVIAAYVITNIYENFYYLKANQIEEYNYATYSEVCILAIHGGDIEIGTTELAKSLATLGNYNYYSSRGIKLKDNNTLHIESDNFTKSIALDMVENSRITLSIHGCKGDDKVTYLGGLNKKLGKKIKRSLEKHGFKVILAKEGLDGSSKLNIVNRNILGKGVQLEISRGLRNCFVLNYINVPSKELIEYTFALYEAIEKYMNS